VTDLLLVDSGIWIDHMRHRDPDLYEALLEERILGHPFVTGEIAMGSLKDRHDVLGLLPRLPQAEQARDEEVLELVEQRRLFSLGLGWVDAHLLASALLTPDTRLWTRDRRLREAAARLGVSGEPAAG
jgi:predicted nucleic acid-binding protein